MFEKPPVLECGGVKVDLADYVDAWEAAAPEHGVYLRASPGSSLRGAVFYFPDPAAATLRNALGQKVRAAEKEGA